MKKLIYIFYLIVFSVNINSWSQSDALFTLLPSEITKVNFNNKIKDTKEQNILLYANFYGGGGVGVGDFNNDGLEDIYFAGNLVSDKLYLNQGDFKFKDVTVEAGIIDDGGWSTGVTVADVNNDGNLDIYISRELYDDKPELRKNLLYINNGKGTFTESAEKYGIADSQRTRHATFFDYDQDGNLDLLLLTQPPNPGSYSEFMGTDLLLPQYHLKLFKNTGNDSFVDVSEKSGINKTGFPNGVSASDLNNDGWTDLYITNDFQAPDFVFINNQNGTFTNIADVALMHMPYYSMGIDVADFNNDELLDIFVVDMVAEDNFRLKANMSGMNPDAFWKVVNNGGHYQYMYNTLQLNNGNTTFSDIAQFTGMQATDWSWSNLIADFDNDGLKDTYITNGLLHDIRNTDADKAVANYINETRNKFLKEHPDGGNLQSLFDIIDLKKISSIMPSQSLKNYVFKNKGNLEFQKTMDKWGLDQESFSNGSVYADLDNDGDLDIIVNNINKKAFVYRNNSERIPNSNYLRVELVDSQNRPVFGTKVKLYTDGDTQMIETTNVRGIYSTSEQVAHFGLGNKVKADSLVVIWPNQHKTVKYNLSANQVLKLSMNESSQLVENFEDKKSNHIFTEQTSSIKFQHKENEFDDYAYQVLLPHKMSQFGPALTKGDINNDGLDDVFVGGAFGQSPALFLQDTLGNFTKILEGFWQKEADYEDVDAVFVDVNNDGFQDLYVVSGGNEFSANNSKYKDRLYINDGKGKFSESVVVDLLNISGSKVLAEDFDQDGDIDIFVGGRHIPHQYPIPTSSMLLLNENGQLKNVTDNLAVGFKDIGMVTDAVWADYNDDGNTDLIVVGEWMPITFFKNVGGKLVKDTVKGLENSAGWWFSIEKGDFDNDGDIDFIAGNLGLNHKYKTSKDKPFDIYYNDFDKNGQYDIVLGYYNGDKHYPLRGFSCSSQQVPKLKKEFKKYDIFASLEIDEVYGDKNLKKSLHYTADTFASSFIENLGNGNFKMTHLPNEAQLSNINDMLVSDFNKDGNLDILTIGNLFVSEIETPRNDAGIGSVLLGDGNNSFKPLSHTESGFFSRGDAKKVQLINDGKQKILLVANNNGKLQVFKVNE